MKKLLPIFALFLGFTVQSQSVFRSQIFNPAVKTLQITTPNEKLAAPILELNGQDALNVSFDELSHNAHSYSYRVLHCNADWTLSAINSNDYLAGFTTANITDVNLSVNTTVLYTHYRFSLPNEDMSFKISGNYVVQVYEDNRVDKPIAQACFYVVEPRVGISGNVRGNTDTELSGRLQQLDVELNLNGYAVRDPSTEIKLLVRQNNRTDNAVYDVKPTFLSNSKLSYINNKALIFEGGSEYHRFDISSVYGGGQGVDIIRFENAIYNAYLFPINIPSSKSYVQDQDVNGRFVVHLQNSQNVDLEADYMRAHLSFRAKQPYFDGQIYVGGELHQNIMNEQNRMNYNATTESYDATMLVKQGGYNYQFWFLPKGQQKASLERVDGSFWQTSNEYTVYVYHRAWGERYDKLVGIKTIQ